MKYSLRSLMIVAMVGPPLLAVGIVAIRHLLEPKPKPITVMPASQKMVVVTIGADLLPASPSQPGEIEMKLPGSQEEDEAGSIALEVLRFWRNEAAANPPKP